MNNHKLNQKNKKHPLCIRRKMKPIEGKQRTPLNSICFRG